MTIMLTSLRTSLAWTWTGAPLLPGVNRTAGAYWPANETAYTAAFERLRVGGSSATIPDVTYPWIPTHRQRYWGFYCRPSSRQQEPAPIHQRDIKAGAAFRNLVPLRVGNLLPKVAAPAGVKLTDEVFLLPTGVALVLNLHLECRAEPDAAIDQLVDLVRTRKLLRLPDGGSHSAMGLATVASVVLARSGISLPAATNQEAPFVLTAVIGAEATGQPSPVADGDALHRVLHGFATLSPTWRTNAIPALADAALPDGGDRPQSHLRLASRDGRCIWHPEFFVKDSQHTSPKKLNCYHRNLLFSGLHTQCLAYFVGHLAGLRQAGGQLDVETDRLRLLACQALGRSYGNAAYSTWSARRWMDDHEELKSVVDAMRRSRGDAALH